MSTLEIEKQNLPVHVELCRDRYLQFSRQLENLDERMSSIETTLEEVKSIINNHQENRQNQIIGWGTGIIASLVGTVAFLVFHIITQGK